MDPTELQIRFGLRLRDRRLAQALSQEELAFRAGLHRTYISSAERGQRNVSLVNIWKLANALSAPMADLVDLTLEDGAPVHKERQAD